MEFIAWKVDFNLKSHRWKVNQSMVRAVKEAYFESLQNEDWIRLLGLPEHSATHWGLKRHNFSSHSPGSQQIEIKVSVGLVSSEASPWLLDIPFWLYPTCTLSSGSSGTQFSVLILSFLKDTSHVGSSLNHVISFYLNYLFKGSLSKQWLSALLGVRTSTYEFCKVTIKLIVGIWLVKGFFCFVLFQVFWSADLSMDCIFLWI